MVRAPRWSELAGNDPDILSNRATADPADHRHIIGAVNGDGNDLAGGAVHEDRREAVSERLAGARVLNGALVFGLSPVALRIESERTQAMVADRRGLDMKCDWSWSTSSMVRRRW